MYTILKLMFFIHSCSNINIINMMHFWYFKNFVASLKSFANDGMPEIYSSDTDFSGCRSH